MHKIYYFSGTGNALYIAKLLSSQIDDCELLPLIYENDPIEGKSIGFVFPVYFARVPIIVERWLEEIKSIKADYIYAVVVGGGLFGSVLDSFNKLLQVRGMHLNAAYTIKTPSNHPKISEFQKQANDQILNQAVSSAKIIADKIVSRESNNYHVLFGKLITHYAFRKPYQMSIEERLDEIFIVNDDCDLCLECLKYCPVNNIQAIDHIEWQHTCINCARCYHICPKEAIEFGNDHMKRYINPMIKKEDLLIGKYN